MNKSNPRFAALQKELDKLNVILNEKSELELKLKQCEDKIKKQESLISVRKFELNNVYIDAIYNELNSIDLAKICYSYITEYYVVICNLCNKTYFGPCCLCLVCNPNPSIIRCEYKIRAEMKRDKSFKSKDYYYFPTDPVDIELVGYWMKCTSSNYSSLVKNLNYYPLITSWFNDDIIPNGSKLLIRERYIFIEDKYNYSIAVEK